MARSLAQTLTLTLTRRASISTTRSATRFLTFRHRSNSPEKFSDGEIDVGSLVEDSEMERRALKKLDDAVHRIIVKKSEPNWLPLVPGGSYWVPPQSKSRCLDQVVGKLAGNSVVKKDRVSYVSSNRGWPSSNRGWPSSAQFFKGASLEGETTPKHSSQSEDEEK